LSQMQENDRAMIDLERLTRAEQRAESLRGQLLDNETKVADLQSRLDQIEFAIKPENIERSQATYGSTRPEEDRAARRRQLENERTRLQNQIRILETGKTRLELAISSADAEVDLIRRKLEAKEQQQDNAQSDQTDKPANNRKKPE
jgi:predicted  nucleic acid-binding Zn-ribbon protein